MRSLPELHSFGVRAIPMGIEDVAYLFGSFRFVPSQRVLLDGGARVSIRGRALELLVALVERPGTLITKRELMDRVWPRTVVDENNLKVHIAALRRILNDGPQDARFIVTVVGKGYQFVAAVTRELLSPAPTETAPKMAYSIPPLLVRPIGRLAVIAELCERLSQVRVLTIAGPGGIGKTTIALSVAHALNDAQTHDVWFVNLSGVSDLDAILLAIARCFGMTKQLGDISSSLTDYLQLRHKLQLVVLDCCEHVIDGAALVTEKLTAVIPHLHVLATSREPLLAIGETVYRVGPLPYPTDPDKLTFDNAIDYPAVELFLERANASRGDFVLANEDLWAVAQVCQRLDGIALAIELAAMRMNAFGIRQLLALLADRFNVLSNGRRTAPDRHKTLLATLEWSHQLLSNVEQIVFRRLGVFPGGFALSSAAAVVADEHITPAAAIEAILSLVAKSLLSVDGGSATTRYRLLDTMRDYARRKLSDAEEVGAMARCHAEHFDGMYALAEPLWSNIPNTQWRDEHLTAIDDVRAALRWAFSEHGDAGLGLTLTVSAIPAWMRMSSLEECRLHVERALVRSEAWGAEFDVSRMKLHSARASASLYTRALVCEVEDASQAALGLAERYGDKEYRLRALFLKCCRLMYAGEHADAEVLIQAFRSQAASFDSAIAMADGDRLIAVTWFLMGRHDDARLIVERSAERSLAQSQRSHLSSNHADGHDGSRALLANILFLQGYSEQAMEVAFLARDNARTSGHVLTYCYVLAFAFIPITLEMRDFVAAEHAIAELDGNVRKHNLVLFEAKTRCLKGTLLLEKGDAAGLAMLSAAMKLRGGEYIEQLYPMHAAMYARGLDAAGRRAEARRVLDAAIDWSRGHNDSWCGPELLRIKAELLGGTDERNARGTAEVIYAQAMDQARQQGALTFELRAAIGLTRLKVEQGNVVEAESLLTDVYDRFAEGFASPDLREAQALLERIRSARQS